MLTTAPILSIFPFAGVHPSVKLYAIFRFEPMHVLSLGVSNMIKECLVNILGDASKSICELEIAQNKD